jgi:hypothetical protein
MYYCLALGVRPSPLLSRVRGLRARQRDIWPVALSSRLLSDVNAFNMLIWIPKLLLVHLSDKTQSTIDPNVF